MGRNEPNLQDLGWLQSQLDALPPLELPASLSADSLFARMDRMEAQGPAPSEEKVLTPDFGAGSNRRAWQRVASVAAVFLVVAVAAYRQGVFDPAGGLGGAAPQAAAPKVASSAAQDAQEEASPMMDAPYAMMAPPEAAPEMAGENPATGGGAADARQEIQPQEALPAGEEQGNLDGGGAMLQSFAKAAPLAGELYHQADLVVTAALPDQAGQDTDTVTVQADRVLKGQIQGRLTLTLDEETSPDPERVYVLFLVQQEGGSYRLLQEPPLLYLSPQEAIRDQEGNTYGTAQAPSF